jgi:6-phosphogluconolactonase
MRSATSAYVGSFTTPERQARGEGITVYRIDPGSGDWTRIQRVGEFPNPSFLALDRTQRFLYAAHGDFSEATAFAIDGKTGEISLLNRQSTGGGNPVHLTVDPTNRHLAVANYKTGSVAALPIAANGSLGPVSSLVELSGAPGPHRREQPSSRPHEIPLDRSGQFFVVPDKGLDKVFVFRLDAGSGALRVVDPAGVTTREGAGPRHVKFDRAGRVAYVLNELDATMTAYRFDLESGALSPFQIVSLLPDSFTGTSQAAEIAVAPSGRFVYASNRGHDSIAILAVDAASGRLAPVDWVATQGRTPRFFTFDPSGDLLHVANEGSDTIVTFRVDPASGGLTPTGQVVATGSPSCIVFRTAAV